MSTKKKFRVPHSFVIVFSIIIAAVLLTWIIPAGEYVRVENADGIKVIDPTQFNYIARTPVNPLLIPMYIVKAFIKRVDIMLVILFSGGAFHMLTQSGALQAVIAKLAKKFSNNLYVFIPILTLMFGLICTTQGVNMFIAFAPVMVMLALAIGLDSITGAAIILLKSEYHGCCAENRRASAVFRYWIPLGMFRGLLCHHQYLPGSLCVKDQKGPDQEPDV